MILVDTSIWIDHFRAGEPGLVSLLQAGQVLSHPAIIGELLLGGLASGADGAATIALLASLPAAVEADHLEVQRLITQERLAGSGIGYVDAHLLAATRLSPVARLWSRDRRLREVARQLGVGHDQA